MEKVKLEILGLQASHSQSGSFALVLGEEAGSRRLPIIIGMFEAQAIAIEMEKIVSTRPMTHDLFKNFAQSFDIDIHEIVISDLKEGIFYAKILCSFANGNNFIELDARPSDAVAIGVRFNAPIYAYENVMKEAGIEVGDIAKEEEKIEEESTKVAKPRQNVKPSSEEPLSKISTEQLKVLLNSAIEQEDYEKAAKIRDELNKRNEA